MTAVKALCSRAMRRLFGRG